MLKEELALRTVDLLCRDVLSKQEGEVRSKALEVILASLSKCNDGGKCERKTNRQIEKKSLKFLDNEGEK